MNRINVRLYDRTCSSACVVHPLYLSPAVRTRSHHCITLAIIAAGIWLGSIYALAGTIIVLFVLGTLMMFFTQAKEKLLRLKPDCKCSSSGEWRCCCFLYVRENTRHRDRTSPLRQTPSRRNQSFVAIDRVTGFDNKQRMKLELSEEIKRAERYGNSFVFTASYALFQRVQIPVRRKETDRLFQFVSSQIRSCVRETDKSSGLPRSGSASC
ncbi:diguanylate cyclase [Bacillus licheniformis]|nr:diguanylate cyclase [Bacillus licheniformis]